MSRDDRKPYEAFGFNNWAPVTVSSYGPISRTSMVRVDRDGALLWWEFVMPRVDTEIIKAPIWKVNGVLDVAIIDRAVTTRPMAQEIVDRIAERARMVWQQPCKATGVRAVQDALEYAARHGSDPVWQEADEEE